MDGALGVKPPGFRTSQIKGGVKGKVMVLSGLGEITRGDPP